MAQLSFEESIRYMHLREVCTWNQMRDYIAQETGLTGEELEQKTDYYWKECEAIYDALPQETQDAISEAWNNGEVYEGDL